MNCNAITLVIVMSCQVLTLFSLSPTIKKIFNAQDNKALLELIVFVHVIKLTVFSDLEAIHLLKTINKPGKENRCRDEMSRERE